MCHSAFDEDNFPFFLHIWHVIDLPKVWITLVANWLSFTLQIFSIFFTILLDRKGDLFVERDRTLRFGNNSCERSVDRRYCIPLARSESSAPGSRIDWVVNNCLRNSHHVKPVLSARSLLWLWCSTGIYDHQKVNNHGNLLTVLAWRGDMSAMCPIRFNKRY